MFKNLEAEMILNGVTKEMMMPIIKVKNNKDLQKRFRGDIEWKLAEMEEIIDKFFPGRTIDYLFKRTQKKETNL